MSPSLKLGTKISLIVALMSLPIVMLGWIYVSKSEEVVAHKRGPRRRPNNSTCSTLGR